MIGIISGIFGLIELALVLRFFFLLFAANPQASFVSWIYNITNPLVAPFMGIFGQPGASLVPSIPNQGTFDIATLISLVVIAAIGGILLALLGRRPNGG